MISIPPLPDVKYLRPPEVYTPLLVDFWLKEILNEEKSDNDYIVYSIKDHPDIKNNNSTYEVYVIYSKKYEKYYFLLEIDYGGEDGIEFFWYRHTPTDHPEILTENNNRLEWIMIEDNEDLNNLFKKILPDVDPMQYELAGGEKEKKMREERQSSYDGGGIRNHKKKTKRRKKKSKRRGEKSKKKTKKRRVGKKSKKKGNVSGKKRRGVKRARTRGRPRS